MDKRKVMRFIIMAILGVLMSLISIPGCSQSKPNASSSKQKAFLRHSEVSGIVMVTVSAEDVNRDGIIDGDEMKTVAFYLSDHTN